LGYTRLAGVKGVNRKTRSDDNLLIFMVLTSLDVTRECRVFSDILQKVPTKVTAVIHSDKAATTATNAEVIAA